jgi:hypothetical protein
MARVQFPVGARDFSLHYSIQTSCMAHSASCATGTGSSSPGVNQADNHSPPSIAKVWNGGVIPPQPPIVSSWRSAKFVKHMNHFTFNLELKFEITMLYRYVNVK